MCFSSTASFGASAILAVIGVATLRKIAEPKQIIFATIPLLFSIQQFSEGFLWLALTDPVYAGLEKPTIYFFLAFAQILWPLFVPLSIYLLEKQEKRKKILLYFSFLGLAVAIARTYWLPTYGAIASIVDYHISYRSNYTTALTNYGAILYFAATVFPFFISDIKRMRYIGITVLVSFIFSQWFYPESVASVWCYFAAIISMASYAIMQDLPEPLKKISPAFPASETNSKHL